jgi:hypothetical protein
LIVDQTLEPTLLWTLRGALAAVLLAVGAHKLRHAVEFGGALRGYRLLPPRLVLPVGYGLAAAEIGLGLGLLLPSLASAAALATAMLFALYAGAIVVNLVRGRRHIDCGCGGPAGRAGISEGLVARNAVLIAAACAAALEPGSRPLVWLDAFSIVAGASTLVLLYAASDGLLANAPRLAPLRSRQ